MSELSSKDLARLEIIRLCRPEDSDREGTKDYAWNELGIAQLFAMCYNDDTRYCPEAKKWYTYSGGAWRKNTGTELVSDKLNVFYKLLVQYCTEVDFNSMKEYIKVVGKLGNRTFHEHVIKFAADCPQMRIRGADFDSNPYLINCKNGTFDLKRNVFYESRPDDFLTYQTRFEYGNDEYKCDRWERFIFEVTQGNMDRARYLQKALGYSILGIANEECMFILHGKTTRNGKSTLLSAIENLLGDYATTAQPELICKGSFTKDPEKCSPVLASLKGRRFVTMSESNHDGKVDEEAIKQFTGGEKLTARKLHEEPITFLPQFTLWLSCNALPEVSDRSLFSSQRLRIITFDKHFSQKEQDKSLKNKFQEMTAMQGIFSWLVSGYYRYLKEGLEMSSAMQKVVDDYARNNDSVLSYLTEKCIQAKDEQIKFKRLYNDYRMWCKANGFTYLKIKSFTTELEAHPEYHEGKTEINGEVFFKGLTLRGITK